MIISDRHLLDPLLPSGDDGSFSSNSFRNVLIGVTNVDAMLEFRGNVNYERKFDLAMVLKTCSRFGATDPRDIVYAVLGLTTDNSRTLIQPNYDEACEPRLVYMKAMLIILLKGEKPLEFSPEQVLDLNELWQLSHHGFLTGVITPKSRSWIKSTAQALDMSLHSRWYKSLTQCSLSKDFSSIKWHIPGGFTKSTPR